MCKKDIICSDAKQREFYGKISSQIKSLNEIDSKQHALLSTELMPSVTEAQLKWLT